MKLSQRQMLYEQYKTKSDEQLKAIIADDGYEDLAKEVAREILNGDRIEYRQQQEQEKQAEQKKQEKCSAQQTDPLYDDIHQIAGDVRFIKNFIIVSIIISLVVMVISLVVANH